MNTELSKLDISKELEIINFDVLNEVPESFLKQDFKNLVVDEKKHKIHEKNDDKAINGFIKKHDNRRERTQFRFTIYSWRFLYTLFLVLTQTVVVMLCFHRLFSTSAAIGSLAFLSFYLSSWCTTVIFLWIATKWSALVKEIFNCNLDDYVDTTIVRRCNISCIAFLCLALFEHILSILSKIAIVFDCTTHDYELYEQLIKQTFPWLFDLGVPFNTPTGILLQYINLISTMNWNYSDMFIVCTSLYLTSILEQINKRIVWAADKTYLPPSIWCTLREDYTRATRLVRLFDEKFSGIILVSFSSNLFFICLQLFNVLANGIQSKQVTSEKCPYYPSGPLHGYEYPLYFIYSLSFLFARFLTVSLVAASVNEASLVPAPAMYRIPSSAYCSEVQRFLDQVHGDIVALSGLDFFYITRDLVLSVAGTIVTYELVLLQFNNEELNNY